jgi:carbon monoxide dehydrogenase subunit G
MNIEGTYTLQASLEDVWQSLADKEVLLQTIPGLVRLEKLDNDTYAVSVQVKYAPLMGTYTGHVTVIEQRGPYYCHLTITGEERQNTVGGSASIHANERNGNTIINYSGSLAIGKSETLLPARVIAGAAKLFIQQFLNALAAYLRERNIIRPRNSELEEEMILVSPASMRQNTAFPALTLRLVRLFGLGKGDPEEEVRWALRMRRGGIAVGLLFLVWVGTRLPRSR